MNTGERHEPPFERTVCGCPTCVQCCREQPGALIPGDAERIEAFLGEPVEQYLWSSDGALVLDTETNRQFRIRTITPRRVRKKCVFLTDEGKCRIHAVAPYGCAYVDTHMGVKAGQDRGMWAVKEHQQDAYQEARKTLPACDSYKPRRY